MTTTLSNVFTVDNLEAMPDHGGQAHVLAPVTPDSQVPVMLWVPEPARRRAW